MNERALLTIPQMLHLLTVGLWRQPQAALQAVEGARRPWLAPTLVTLLGVALLTASALPRMTALMRSSGAALSAGGARAAALLASPDSAFVVGTLGFLLLVVLCWLGQGLALVLAARLCGQPLALRATLRLMPWLWLPLALRMGVQGLYGLLGGRIFDNGLSFLLSAGAPTARLATLGWQMLWQLDLFFVWHLALVLVALHRPGRTSARAVDSTLLYGLLALMLLAQVGSFWQGR